MLDYYRQYKQNKSRCGRRSIVLSDEPSTYVQENLGNRPFAELLNEGAMLHVPRCFYLFDVWCLGEGMNNATIRRSFGKNSGGEGFPNDGKIYFNDYSALI